MSQVPDSLSRRSRPEVQEQRKEEEGNGLLSTVNRSASPSPPELHFLIPTALDSGGSNRGGGDGAGRSTAAAAAIERLSEDEIIIVISTLLLGCPGRLEDVEAWRKSSGLPDHPNHQDASSVLAALVRSAARGAPEGWRLMHALCPWAPLPLRSLDLSGHEVTTKALDSLAEYCLQLGPDCILDALRLSRCQLSMGQPSEWVHKMGILSR